MAGRFPNSQLTTISNTPSRNQLIYHLPAPVRHRRSRKEPVSRKIEPDARSIFRQISCYLKRSIPQLAQLITQIIHLRCTCQLFRIRERERHAVIILVRSRQAKPERSICQLPTNTDFAFGGFTGKDTFKLLVEIAIKPCTRFDARHFPCRIEFVTIHPVDAETLQMSLLIKKTDTVSVVERLYACHREISPALFLQSAHLLSQRFGRIERSDLPSPSLQEIMGETAAETLVQLWLEIETAGARRSTGIFLATGKNGIELPTVSRRHILHIGHILQAAFYLQRSGSGIQQFFQHLALVEVLQRKQMLITHNGLAIGIYQTEG